MNSKQKHGNQIAYRIIAELVCCDIYARTHGENGDFIGTDAEWEAIDNGSHALCFWGAAAARIAARPKRWKDDPADGEVDRFVA